jgi:hypothetical protein
MLGVGMRLYSADVGGLEGAFSQDFSTMRMWDEVVDLYQLVMSIECFMRGPFLRIFVAENMSYVRFVNTN